MKKQVIPGRIVANWADVDLGNPLHQRQVTGALRHFMQAHERPEVKQALRIANLRHFATNDDFPASVADILDRYHLTDFVDEGANALFRSVDYTGSTKSSFELREVTSGLVFVEIQPGGKVEINKMAGARTTVPFVRYGGGLGWARELIDDKDYWGLEDNAIEFRNEFLKLLVNTKIALVEALPDAQAVTWQAPTPAALANTDAKYTAIRDANTINAACLKVITDCSGLGMNVGPNTPIEIVAPLALRGRISAALGVSLAADPAVKVVQFNVTTNYTLLLSDNTTYYVGIPGQKSIHANRQNLEILTDFDIQTRSDVAVGWTRFADVIGETKQIAVCATS